MNEPREAPKPARMYPLVVVCMFCAREIGRYPNQSRTPTPVIGFCDRAECRALAARRYKQ